MENITVKEIVAATGGRLLCGNETQKIAHLSIDSRTMKGNDLFVPLIGEKVDAHRFIEQAFGAGAVAVLTSEHDTAEDAEHAWIRVADTKKALQDIGRYYRSRLSLPLVGITGSVGKTTTREMVAAALSAKYQVYKTPKFQQPGGVPITLSEITLADEIGVLELGMSMPGELTVIAKIAQVDMAVITNVGITHIEQLGSQENIYHEKLTIQDGLKDGGILFLNGDDPLLKDTKAKAGCVPYITELERIPVPGRGYPQRGWLPGVYRKLPWRKVYGALKHHGAPQCAECHGGSGCGRLQRSSAFRRSEEPGCLYRIQKPPADRGEKWSYHY